MYIQLKDINLNTSLCLIQNNNIDLFTNSCYKKVYNLKLRTVGDVMDIHYKFKHKKDWLKIKGFGIKTYKIVEQIINQILNNTKEILPEPEPLGLFVTSTELLLIEKILRGTISSTINNEVNMLKKFMDTEDKLSNSINNIHSLLSFKIKFEAKVTELTSKS